MPKCVTCVTQYHYDPPATKLIILSPKATAVGKPSSLTIPTATFQNPVPFRHRSQPLLPVDSIYQRKNTALLRIANIIEESRYGGPQRRIALVAEKLKNHGIETTVVCARMGADRFLEELDNRGIPNRALKLHRLTRNPPELLAAILLFPLETLRLARFLRHQKFDLVHCNGSWQWKGVLAAWLAHTRIVWHLNDTHVPRPIRFLFRHLARHTASGFIVAGERVKRYYLNSSPLSERPIFTIPAPVDCRRFSRKSGNPEPEIAALPGVKVVTVANLNPSKGLETLVRVAACFKNEDRPVISFVVIGQLFESQKKYLDSLKGLQHRLGASNLHLLGPRTDIPSCLRAADIGLCCSVAEASPMAVWETAAAGLPVVATDVGDIKRLNKQWGFAHVASVDDVERLVELIRKLANNPDEGRHLGANGVKMAQHIFDLDACVKLHADAYRALA